LHGLGFEGASDIRQGKYIELDVSENDKAAAKSKVEDMCRTLLANTVIENYSVEILD
jgi:phosphoribosylformylglycinamidine synthase PurS subunit